MTLLHQLLAAVVAPDSSGVALCSQQAEPDQTGFFSDDKGTNTGYILYLNTANKFILSAGNGAVYSPNVSTATIDVGTKYLLTAWMTALI